MKTKEEHLHGLEEDLKPWLPREGEMGIIFSAAAEVSKIFDVEAEKVKQGLILQEATSKAEIENISESAGITTNDSESLEDFRKRALARFQTITSSGSPEDILTIANLLPNVNKENIVLDNIDTKAKFSVKAPSQSIESEFGTTEDVINLLLNATATTYGLNVFGIGTLDYVTPTELQNGNYDSAEVYATLDSNGNITSGGTYSGYYDY